jgi:hypothetical protein
MLDILVCGDCAQCGADTYLKLHRLTYIVYDSLVVACPERPACRNKEQSFDTTFRESALHDP